MKTKKERDVVWDAAGTGREMSSSGTSEITMNSAEQFFRKKGFESIPGWRPQMYSVVSEFVSKSVFEKRSYKPGRSILGRE
jgi:hypothetical protein